MTAEQLQALYQITERKRKGLEARIPPGQAAPIWIQKEFEFIADFELMAQRLYQATAEIDKVKEQNSRLYELVEMLDGAFNQLLKNRPALVHFTGTVETLPVGPAVFLRMAQLMPQGVNRLQTLQFYHEYTSDLLKGRSTARNQNTTPTTGDSSAAA